jgi:hypothetical protein
MDQYPTAEIFAGAPGAIAPADGNYAPNGAQGASPTLLSNARGDADESDLDASP